MFGSEPLEFPSGERERGQAGSWGIDELRELDERREKEIRAEMTEQGGTREVEFLPPDAQLVLPVKDFSDPDSCAIYRLSPSEEFPQGELVLYRGAQVIDLNSRREK